MASERERIEQAIIEIIDAPDHYCIARSEGQACCIDPRPTADPGFSYGGEAIAAGLIDRILEVTRG